MKKQCVECGVSLDRDVFDYSVQKFSAPLCRLDQNRIREMGSTPDAINLYLALRSRNIPAELEKSDGFKTIDIAVPKAKVNIEVDGGHHNYSSRQALADLKRTYYSFAKGYMTFRIPNALVQSNLEETADLLKDMIGESMNRRR